MTGKLKERFDRLVKGRYSDDNANILMSRSKIRAIIWDKSGGRCWYCGVAMNPFSEFSIDHLIPRSEGGDETFDNLVPCCRWCNSSKSQADIETFRKNLAIRMSEIPLFSDEQLRYLDSQGVEVKLLKPQDFKFWFEKVIPQQEISDE